MDREERAAKEDKGEEWTGRKDQPRRRKERTLDGRKEGAAKEGKGEKWTAGRREQPMMKKERIGKQGVGSSHG